MLAIALVLEGRSRSRSRSEAARSAGMDRQTLRDWVHRYNDDGLAGLANRPNPGRPRRKLTAEQEASLAAWVRQGPPPDGKLVRWRLIDPRDEIAQQFGVRLHERTIGKLMAHQTGGKLRIPDNTSLLPLPPRFARAEPSRKRLAVLAAKLPRQPRLRNLRRHRRCMLQCLE